MARSTPTAPTPPPTQRARRYLFVSLPRRWSCSALPSPSSCPSAYAVLGGLRTTGELRNRPFDLPTDWFPQNYIDCPPVGDVLDASSSTASSSPPSRPSRWWPWRPWRPSPSRACRFPGRERPSTRSSCWDCSSRPPSPSCRSSSSSDSSACWTTPLGVALPQAAFGLPTHDRHPAALLPGHPHRARGCCRASTAAARFGFFWRVVLPLSRPALATVAVLAIVGSWNAFLLPLLVLADREPVDAATGRHELLRPQYTADTAARPGLHHAVPGPRAGLLCHRRTPDRRRPHSPARSRDDQVRGGTRCQVRPSPAAGVQCRPARRTREPRRYRDRRCGPSSERRQRTLLLARMTLDEKLAQLGSLWSFEVFDGQGLDLERARQRLGERHRAGHARGRRHQPAARGRSPSSAGRSSASSSRRHDWASRPSSMRRACTASWPPGRPASSSRSARPPPGTPISSRRSRGSSASACAGWARARPWLPSWTSAAIRAGVAWRRPTAKTPT